MSYELCVKKAVLLVEDNADVLEFNQFLLEKQGFAVETAATLAAARDIVERRMPDAIVLDIGLPDGSGLDFLKNLRKSSKVPVLVLTGYGNDDDVVRGFKSGCDDYLSKPYTFEVLLARLENMLFRTRQITGRTVYGVLELDVIVGKAFLHGADLFLAQREFALLLTLAQNAGQAQSAEFLYEKAWGQPLSDNTSALKNMVYRLRKKIKGSGYDIFAYRGLGYVFEATTQGF